MAFELPENSLVTISIYDVAGRRLRTVADGIACSAGEHAVEWDGCTDEGTPAASGVYFYSIEAAGERLTGRVVLLR
jgi:flagellar hook assembly protein FlgD